MDYRYIDILAINVKGELIPIWEFNYEKTEYETECYTHNDRYGTYNDSSVISCKYDMLTKEVVRYETISLDNKPKFDIGETCFIEVSGHVLRPCKVKEIVRGKICYDKVVKIKEILSWSKQCTSEVPLDKLDKNIKYNLMVYDPKYIMEDGTECEWEHQLYKIKQD